MDDTSHFSGVSTFLMCGSVLFSVSVFVCLLCVAPCILSHYSNKRSCNKISQINSMSHFSFRPQLFRQHSARLFILPKVQMSRPEQLIWSLCLSLQPIVVSLCAHFATTGQICPCCLFLSWSLCSLPAGSTEDPIQLPASTANHLLRSICSISLFLPCSVGS